MGAFALFAGKFNSEGLEMGWGMCRTGGSKWQIKLTGIGINYWQCPNNQMDIHIIVVS
jgi:hypothetical protein